MNNDIRDEGQAANMRGELREDNPYPCYGQNRERVEWDRGWLLQTQGWSMRPESMCNGKNCTALKGFGHSDECIKEHNDATHVFQLIPM